MVSRSISRSSSMEPSLERITAPTPTQAARAGFKVIAYISSFAKRERCKTELSKLNFSTPECRRLRSRLGEIGGTDLNRRNFLAYAAAATAGGSLFAWLRIPILGQANEKPDSNTVTVIQFSDAGKMLGAIRVKKVLKTDAEWKQQLTPLQF